MSKLTPILEYKKREVAAQKTIFPISLLQKSPLFEAHSRKLKPYLEQATTPKIIAEFKRFSLNEPQLHPFADANEVTEGYEKAGASALSVLTDTRFFGGSLADLQMTASTSKLPVLQKDFIIDEYQLYQAKAFGADVILLIGSALSPQLSKKLTKKAKSLGLEVLLELHPNDDFTAYDLSLVDFVGVNNRNLKTFEIDMYHSFKMVEVLPKEVVKISESGLTHPQDVQDLFDLGYKAMLMGTAFMREKEPYNALSSFIQSLETQNSIHANA